MVPFSFSVFSLLERTTRRVHTHTERRGQNPFSIHIFPKREKAPGSIYLFLFSCLLSIKNRDKKEKKNTLDETYET
jgi:hypothetical protein